MKLQRIRRPLLGAMLAAGLMGSASQAHALDIDASNLSGWTLNLNYWELTSFPPAATDVLGVQSTVGVTGLAEVYKANYGGSESGTAAMYYGTGFSGDPNNATITQGGAYYIVCPDCYLVVKDGNAVPHTYIFDIDGWNGVEAINLTNFWPGPGGAISYVGIYNTAAPGGGGSIAMVPEPETYAMLLAGLGLVGFAARRKLA